MEEALCFGWVDSIIQRIDDEKYARKFTPRTNVGKWSETNRKRAAKCIREGRMTQAGLEKVGEGGLNTLPEPEPRPKEIEIPPEILDQIKHNPIAWDSFVKLAPSLKKRYFLWVLDAKREETRSRRLEEVIHALELNIP